MYCPMCSNTRSAVAAGGISTPKIASQALADASWWLTGQMPQMRCVMIGISSNGRPWQKRS